MLMLKMKYSNDLVLESILPLKVIYLVLLLQYATSTDLFFSFLGKIAELKKINSPEYFLCSLFIYSTIIAYINV